MTRRVLAALGAAATLIAAAVVGRGTAADAPAAPAAHPVDAPASTITLSRAGRIDGVPLRMDIALLRRAGRTATLDIRLRSTAPHGGPTLTIGDAFSPTVNYRFDGVYLMDPLTGRKLPVRHDAHGDCICTGDLLNVELPPGSTTMLTASFPAPSAAARTADVIVPHFGAFRDVPLHEG